MRLFDWSKDGRYIIERTGIDAKTTAIWVLPFFGDKKPFPYLQTDANESWAKLSPNGQWLAYQSDESKRNEIYVTAFPEPGGKFQFQPMAAGIRCGAVMERNCTILPRTG